MLSRIQDGTQIPTVAIYSEDKFNGRTVLWLDGAGKQALFDELGQPIPAVRSLLDAGAAVVSADLFLTGEFVLPHLTGDYPVDTFSGYTLGYNRPLISHRVRDVLTVLAILKNRPEINDVRLIATNGAGPWALLSVAVAGDAVSKTVADLGGHSFTTITDVNDPNLLPGALKYGGLGGLTAAGARSSLTLYGVGEATQQELGPLQQLTQHAGIPFTVSERTLNADQVPELLGK